MHRDVINFVVVTRGTDFVITTSIDGHLKLWKKQEQGIEFVKHYRAHLAPVVAVSASADGQLFASVAEDGSVKVFDVVNFGTIQQVARHDLFRSPPECRHDQYAQAFLCPPCLLLGPPTRSSPRTPCHVSHSGTHPVRRINDLQLSKGLGRGPDI